MKFWIKLAAVLLGFSGLVFLFLLLVLGFSIWEALGCVIVLLAVLLALESREQRAPDLRMRESTWYTPEDEDDIAR